MDKFKNRSQVRHSSERWVNAAFGLFFVGIAVAIIFVAPDVNSIGAYIVAFVIGALGVDALFCTVCNRRSLLSYIGPLP